MQELPEKELMLARAFGVGIGPTFAKCAPQRRVEPARRDIDVLCFDLDLGAASVASPRLRCAKQCSSNAAAVGVRCDPDVPQHREIATTFEHVEPGSATHDGCAPNDLPVVASHDQMPGGGVKVPGPLAGWLTECVVVLQIRRIDGVFSELERSVWLWPRCQCRPDENSHWNGGVFAEERTRKTGAFDRHQSSESIRLTNY